MSIRIVATAVATLFSGLVLASASAQAENLTGVWIATGYSCSNVPSTELVRITDDGVNYQAVKLRGDRCVTAGSVTFFGIRKGSQSFCKAVLGDETEPNSVIDDCGGRPVVAADGSFTLPGLGLSFRRTTIGTTDAVRVTRAECRNTTTGRTVAGTLTGTNEWSCERLPMKTNDTVVQTITGRVE